MIPPGALLPDGRPKKSCWDKVAVLMTFPLRRKRSSAARSAPRRWRACDARTLIYISSSRKR